MCAQAPARKLLQAFGYPRLGLVADPGCHGHQQGNQQTATDQDDTGCTTGACTLLDELHAGFAGKGVQPSSVFFRDLHGVCSGAEGHPMDTEPAGPLPPA